MYDPIDALIIVHLRNYIYLKHMKLYATTVLDFEKNAAKCVYI